MPVAVKPEAGLPESWVKALSWRCIGPASMGGRIVAIAVYEADPSMWWIATASGGLLKTINNGNTFEHQFDREATVSIGDVAVAQSDSKIVWVGTGENNPRNSVSYGDGVYKSSDGGKSWKNMGLKKTFQIGRIAIHPKNPDIVYVGALGRLYGPSEERGVYKTMDGGKTWNKVLTIDDRTGVIDLQMDPSNPETLLAAAWERRRDGFDSHPGDAVPLEEGYDRYDPSKKWGPKSGIYRTTDGGKKWDRVTKGLPTCDMGRIGMDFYRKDPKTVFAIIDSARIGMGTPPKQTFLGVQGENVDGGGAKIIKVTADSPAAKGGLKAGDVIKAVDKDNVANYPELVGRIQGKKEGDKVVFTVQPRQGDAEDRGDSRNALADECAAAVQFLVRRPSAKMCRASRGRTATNTAASTSLPMAAKAGRASTASTPGRCISARSASIPATRSICTSSASRSIGRTMAARRSRRTAAGVFIRTSTPCGSIRATAGMRSSAATAASTSLTIA